MADSANPETQSALLAFRKAMAERCTILDKERIDNFYLNDAAIRSEIHTYGDDEEGYVSYGADKAAERLKKTYPELFSTNKVHHGGTPPRASNHPPVTVAEIATPPRTVESIMAGARRVVMDRLQQTRGLSPQSVLRLKRGPQGGKM